ncbi:hypothetical protein F5Y19DRAFT_478390 [Xylariaceae sp. FL1651]|nr:hypothetical protein F5Y19DRAFT_478390 [Xylariaceae sp. FL1651]
MLGHQGLLLLLWSRLAFAGSLGARAKNAPTGPFGLYAYGSGIGGAPVIYSQGKSNSVESRRHEWTNLTQKYQDVAFIGDLAEMDNLDAARVVFTQGSDNSLLGSPDMASARGSPSWSNKAFFVPSSTASSHRVGFTNTTSSTDTSTSGFIFYGPTALHQGSADTLQSLWYVVPTQFRRVWALEWNATDDRSEDKVSITLRSIPPSRAF